MAFDTPLAGEIWSSKYRFAPHGGRGDTDGRGHLAPDRPRGRRGRRPGASRAARGGILRRLAGSPLPAGRPDHRRRGHRPQRHAVQLLRHGGDPDDLDGIFDHVREAALTMQQGGGVGMDFSTLRPAGAFVSGVAAEASGPLSFMDVWDAMCRTIMSAGQRRGAMMGCLRIDHPDIEAFIDAKRDGRPSSAISICRCWSATPSWPRSRPAATGRLTFDGEVHRRAVRPRTSGPA